MDSVPRSNREILADLLSKDSKKIWWASGEVISECQNPDRIMPLVPFRDRIARETREVSMGGAVAPNRRFVDLVLKILDFYGKGRNCPCGIYPMAGSDSTFRPSTEKSRGNIEILERVESGGFPDYYVVQCTRCGQKFRVKEGMYHFVWWQWIPMSRVSETGDAQP